MDACDMCEKYTPDIVLNYIQITEQNYIDAGKIAPNNLDMWNVVVCNGCLPTFDVVAMLKETSYEDIPKGE